MVKNLCAVILAGGRGTRMGSKFPKVLLPIADRPIIFWTLDLLGSLNMKEIVVVTGRQSSLLRNSIKKTGYKVTFVEQASPLGTADAVKVALTKVPKRCEYILILYGDDSGLYSSATMINLLDRFSISKSPGAVLATRKPGAFPLGGIKRDRKGDLVGLVTHDEMVKTKIFESEILCGALVFERKWLEENIGSIPKNKLTGEYNLPSIIKIASDKGEYLETVELHSQREWSSVNTQESLATADKLKREILKDGES